MTCPWREPLRLHRRRGTLSVLQILPSEGVLRVERHPEPCAQPDGREEHPRHGYGRRRQQHAVSVAPAAWMECIVTVVYGCYCGAREGGLCLCGGKPCTMFVNVCMYVRQQCTTCEWGYRRMIGDKAEYTMCATGTCKKIRYIYVECVYYRTVCCIIIIAVALARLLTPGMFQDRLFLDTPLKFPCVPGLLTFQPSGQLFLPCDATLTCLRFRVSDMFRDDRFPAELALCSRALVYLYPFGASVNVVKPAVPLLSTGSVAFPGNRPVRHLTRRPASLTSTQYYDLAELEDASF